MSTMMEDFYYLSTYLSNLDERNFIFICKRNDKVFDFFSFQVKQSLYILSKMKRCNTQKGQSQAYWKLKLLLFTVFKSVFVHFFKRKTYFLLFLMLVTVKE